MCLHRCSGRQERTWTHWRITSGCVSETQVLCKEQQTLLITKPSQPIRQSVYFNQYLGLNFNLLFGLFCDKLKQANELKSTWETQRKSISKWSPEGIPYSPSSLLLGLLWWRSHCNPQSDPDSSEPQPCSQPVSVVPGQLQTFHGHSLLPGASLSTPSPRQGLTEISLPLKGVHHCARLTRAFLKPGFWLFWTESHHKFLILNLNLAF